MVEEKSETNQMIRSTLKNIVHLFYGNEYNRIRRKALILRNDSEKRIQRMIADLDGRSDDWFTLTLETKDKCPEK